MLHQNARPTVNIVGNFNRKQLFCAGSVSKMLTTFVVLSFLSEKFNLQSILDDKTFLDKICSDKPVLGFLQMFQKKIGSQFTLRDLCTFHAGLPYTFDPAKAELESVDAGNRFTHQSVMDEKTFLDMCENNVTMIYGNRQKFHYSEISMMILGYLIEKVYDVRMEDLYQKFVVKKFKLSNSGLSRTRPDDVYYKDISTKYDYACVALQDHGYFCYGNGYYTTLDDLAALLEQINADPVFSLMASVHGARRAEDKVMNGLTVELRIIDGDVVFGYEGMSFSGCTSIVYSTKMNAWFITFGENAEDDFNTICAKLGYAEDCWDDVPEYSKTFYTEFTTNYAKHNPAFIPLEYQGNYRRVKLNDGKELEYVSVLGNNYLEIRDPEPVRYDLVQVNKEIHIEGDDGVKDSRVGLYTVEGGNRYLFYNGNMYREEIQVEKRDETLTMKAMNF